MFQRVSWTKYTDLKSRWRIIKDKLKRDPKWNNEIY